MSRKPHAHLNVGDCFVKLRGEGGEERHFVFDIRPKLVLRGEDDGLDRLRFERHTWYHDTDLTQRESWCQVSGRIGGRRRVQWSEEEIVVLADLFFDSYHLSLGLPEGLGGQHITLTVWKNQILLAELRNNIHTGK